ncbi:MAG: UDP-glucose 4-epimerase GalE [Chloroflexi bacterium]|nr:UDP-glucose 4-epimerase GalE [Chloroflexota bacterium]
MKVLVVGGAGYIGSVTARRLIDRGAEVIIYDNLSTGHRGAAPRGGLFVEGDLADAARLDSLFKGHPVHAVMHFAAFIQVGESMEAPQKYFTNNVANVINLLNVMLQNGVMRFVFSSSAAVYGEPESVPIEESAPLAPNNPYGETKLMVERVLAWYSKLLGLRYAAFRYFNACGAFKGLGEDHHPETHLIPIVLQAALGQRDAVTIYGADYPTPDGTCIRDYVHVADLAEAHILALTAMEEEPALSLPKRQARGVAKGSLVYNLGNGSGHSVKQVIEVARAVTGRPIKAVEGARRPGDAASLVASSRRAVTELGWRPEYADLAAIVRSAWEWHKEHPRGYQG